jgi:septin 3/9/12
MATAAGAMTETRFFRTHLQDLIETTAQIHYEAFRSKQLLALKENARPQQA